MAKRKSIEEPEPEIAVRDTDPVPQPGEDWEILHKLRPGDRGIIGGYLNVTVVQTVSNGPALAAEVRFDDQKEAHWINPTLLVKVTHRETPAPEPEPVATVKSATPTETVELEPVEQPLSWNDWEPVAVEPEPVAVVTVVPAGSIIIPDSRLKLSDCVLVDLEQPVEITTPTETVEPIEKEPEMNTETTTETATETETTTETATETTTETATETPAPPVVVSSTGLKFAIPVFDCTKPAPKPAAAVATDGAIPVWRNDVTLSQDQIDGLSIVFNSVGDLLFHGLRSSWTRDTLFAACKKYFPNLRAGQNQQSCNAQINVLRSNLRGAGKLR